MHFITMRSHDCPTVQFISLFIYSALFPHLRPHELHQLYHGYVQKCQSVHRQQLRQTERLNLEHRPKSRARDRKRYQYHAEHERPNQIPVVPEFLREDHRSVSLAVESVEKSAAAQRAERHGASQQCTSTE